MNIIIESKVNKMDIRAGDIVVIEDIVYMIQEDPHGWVAKDLNGSGGATGRKGTLRELVDSFIELDFEHYSQKDYDLKLVPKVKN